MRLYNILSFIRKSKFYNSHQSLISCKRNHFYYINSIKVHENSISKQLSACLNLDAHKLSRKIHETTSNCDEFEELEAELLLAERESYLEEKSAKNLLYLNNDHILKSLNNCASMQEVFTVYKENEHSYTHQHAVQTILVLNDLQRVLHQMIGAPKNSKNDFIISLHKRTEFKELLNLINKKIPMFNRAEANYMLYYLSALGIEVTNSLCQLLVAKVRNDLLERFSLPEASRFFRIVFSEVSLRSFLVVQQLIPPLINKTDCFEADELEDLSICLSKIHRLINTETLQKYKKRLSNLKDNGDLHSGHYKGILKAASFLSAPRWGDECTKLASECLLLLKNQVHLLNPNDLILLYDVFSKIQQPREILTEIQRYSQKFIRSLKEEFEHESSFELKLFLPLVYFLSPLQRKEYQQIAKKYVSNSKHYDNEDLIILARILSHIKVSDINLCENLWKIMLLKARNAESALDVLKLCDIYIKFHTDVYNYQYKPFERYCLSYLKRMYETTYIKHLPSKVCNILAFFMIYGEDKRFVGQLLNNLENNWEQLDHLNCLLLSQCIKVLNTTPNPLFTYHEFHQLHKLIDKVIEKELEIMENDIGGKKMGVLLKSRVLKKSDIARTSKLMDSINQSGVMSSKSLENICFTLSQANALHSELLDQCTEYVVENKDHVLGHKAEKVLCLCYRLGYVPKNKHQFINTVIDIIIREQERLSGLSILKSALALCYYNSLPMSLIKLIFNVEFLERLETELKNCYYKDRYPQLVRHNLMQLNRAVCLEYPEADVSWIHEKYIHSEENPVIKNLKKSQQFSSRAKDYFIGAVGKPEYVNQNVITPYGYYIDFEINLNHNGKLVEPGSADIKRKIAFIFLQKKAYTKYKTLFKGKYQLMMRHLEILGYEVVFIGLNDWNRAVYTKQTRNYLSSIICPNTGAQSSTTNM